MLVNADEKTLEKVAFNELRKGDEVFVVTKHETGQTFIAQAPLTHKHHDGSWKSGDLVIVTNPNLMVDWVRENREIYRKKFVFPESWGSVISVYDEELREDRRFLKISDNRWIRQVDSNHYTDDQLRKYYPGKFTVLRDGV